MPEPSDLEAHIDNGSVAAFMAYAMMPIEEFQGVFADMGLSSTLHHSVAAHMTPREVEEI